MSHWWYQHWIEAPMVAAAEVLPTAADCAVDCPPSCASVFDRVVVSYLRRGGTRVMWELRDDFTDPMPYTFQLQVGGSASNDAGDWEDVGLPAANLYTAVDGEQRVWGKTNWTHYRVQLQTPIASYLSDPVAGMGTLSRRDWLHARETLRQELVRMRRHAGQVGYLLKRRITGTPCPTCLDHQTNEVRDASCPSCWGTGFLCGYFYPIDCVWADIDPKTYRIHQDDQRGTVNDVVVKARMVNTWMLSQEDIWVSRVTDDRYAVHAVQNTSEMRGVPLTANVELRPLPATHVAYDIAIPQQLEALET